MMEEKLGWGWVDGSTVRVGWLVSTFRSLNVFFVLGYPPKRGFRRILEIASSTGPSGRGLADAACRGKVSVLPLLSADSEPRGPGPQGEAYAHVFVRARGRSSFRGTRRFQSCNFIRMAFPYCASCFGIVPANCQTMRPTSAALAVIRRRFPLPSVSFSGAGFLGCYHAGVSACLARHGVILSPGETALPGERPPILTGVSAGSMIAAAMMAGVDPDDGMSVILEAARKTRERGGPLDVLRPGFSLVDAAEAGLLRAMRRALGGTGDSSDDYDNELFHKRTSRGKDLRIGLIEWRSFSLTDTERPSSSYRYVDGYRDLEDAVSAAILSSYIPGLTGTIKGVACPHNGAVRRAWKKIKEMEQLGFVKDGRSGQPVNNLSGDSLDCDVEDMKQRRNEGKREVISEEKEDELRYWDGGLVELCPTINHETVLVIPFSGVYSPNPVICPTMPGDQISEDKEEDTSLKNEKSDMSSTDSLTKGSTITGRDDENNFDNTSMPFTIPLHSELRLAVNSKNVETGYRMAHSSDDDVLQDRFYNGYDDAQRFLKEKDLLTIFDIAPPPAATPTVVR